MVDKVKLESERGTMVVERKKMRGGDVIEMTVAAIHRHTHSASVYKSSIMFAEGHLESVIDALQKMRPPRPQATGSTGHPPVIQSCFLHGRYEGEYCMECGKQPALVAKRRADKARRMK